MTNPIIEFYWRDERWAEDDPDEPHCPYFPAAGLRYDGTVEPGDLDNLVDPDEIVIGPKWEGDTEPVRMNLLFTYPLGVPYMTHHVAPRPEGFTRRDIIPLIVAGYKHVYDSEPEPTPEQQSQVPLLNRGFTEGPYRIWGHVIGDLDFHSLRFVDSPEIWDVMCDS